MSERTATVVLVHGAWAGSWIWEDVLPLLSERGLEARVVDLPSCGADAEELADLHGDAAAIREALDRINGDIVLCGHSYGGMPITGAAAGHERVRRLLYLCAFMPAEGESLLGIFGGEVPSFWRIRDDLTVVPELNAEDPLQARVAPRRVQQSLLAFVQPPAAIAWRTTPSTYAVCTNDRSIPVDLQRWFATRATETVEIPTGHLPMLERPELVVDLLARLARHDG
jgi:pimeloyl-ACP methyl ester carboxylesterase